MDDEIKALAAGGHVSMTILFALMAALREKGILSVDEQREILETALQLLEKAQGAAPASQEIFESAREMIEGHIRSQASSPGKT